MSLNIKQQWIIAGLLLLVIMATRSHILSTHIQDASWAIFFLLGFYISKQIGLPVFLMVAVIVDLLVIESKGGESYCFTVSYPFLVPAYASLWFAGRWFANHYSENLFGLAKFVGAAVLGIVVCDIISSGGFYWFSGRFAEVSMTEFVHRLSTFMPMFMKTTLFHLGIAAVIHVVVVQANKLTSHTHT